MFVLALTVLPPLQRDHQRRTRPAASSGGSVTTAKMGFEGRPTRSFCASARYQPPAKQAAPLCRPPRCLSAKSVHPSALHATLARLLPARPRAIGPSPQHRAVIPSRTSAAAIAENPTASKLPSELKAIRNGFPPTSWSLASAAALHSHRPVAIGRHSCWLPTGHPGRRQYLAALPRVRAVFELQRVILSDPNAMRPIETRSQSAIPGKSQQMYNIREARQAAEDGPAGQIEDIDAEVTQIVPGGEAADSSGLAIRRNGNSIQPTLLGQGDRLEAAARQAAAAPAATRRRAVLSSLTVSSNCQAADRSPHPAVSPCGRRSQCAGTDVFGGCGIGHCGIPATKERSDGQRSVIAEYGATIAATPRTACPHRCPALCSTCACCRPTRRPRAAIVRSPKGRISEPCQ